MRKCVFIGLIWLLCCAAALPEGRFLNYRAEDGLPSNTVYAIVQDGNGCLWIGTSNGLCRFDGARFQTIQDGLPARRVTSLAVDAGGRLWVGTKAGLCVRMPGQAGHDGAVIAGTDRQFPVPGNFRALLTDSDGYIWATVGDSLLLKLSYTPSEGIREEARTPYSKRYNEGDYPYYQIYEDHAGMLWLGGRLVRAQFVQDRARPESRLRFSDTYCTGSYAESGGILYGFDDHLSTLNTFEGAEVVSHGRLPISHARLLTDSRGRLWAAGSYGLGIVNIAKPEQTIVYKHKADDRSSIASAELYCIFEDRQGNIWVGGDSGLSVLCPELQQVHVPDLPSTQVSALMQARDGRLWVGTADSGAYVLGDARSGPGMTKTGPGMTHIDYRPAGRSNEGHVSCLYEDSTGAVYIGLYAGCGFNIWQNGRVRRGAVSGPIPKEQEVVAWGDRITSNWITDFLEDGSGRFWVVTWEGVGMNEWDRKTGKTAPPEWLSPFFYPTARNDSSIYLSSRLGNRLILDKDGNLVYGTTEAGLNIIDKDTRLVTKYLTDPSDSLSIPDNYVTDLCLAPDGVLWVATRGGLWTPSGRRLLNGMMVQSLRADAKGRLWAGTEEGLYFIDTDGSTGIARTGLGFPSDVYGEKVACTISDGRLAFGGNAGAAIFHPDSLLEYALVSGTGRESSVLLADFSLEGGRLQFSFSSVNLPLASQCRYRYKLDGVDKDWIEARYPELSGLYGGLLPGRYTLRIACTDVFGRWGSELSLPVRVRAPILLRWPFILLYVLLLGAAVWLVMRLRERKLLRDNARLEAAVSNLFSIITHDLRGPVYALRGLSGQLVRNFGKIPPEDTLKALETMEKASNNTSNLLENLLMWTLNQKGVMAPVMREEDISEIVSSAVAGRKEVETKLAVGMTAMTDRNMLSTCLRNLLENAIRYTPEGEKVTLEVLREPGFIKINVRDKGPGMEEDVLRNLSRQGHLGLVITRELVERMEGKLSARNISGGGCEMTIMLPYDEKD